MYSSQAVAKESQKKKSLWREHVFAVFVRSVVHFRFYGIVMSYNHET